MRQGWCPCMNMLLCAYCALLSRHRVAPSLCGAIFVFGNRVYQCEKVTLDGKCIYNDLQNEGENDVESNT